MTPVAITVAVLSGLLTLLTFFYFIRRANRRARARKHDRLRVFTFANHKGGVGKTTSAFFVAQRLARDSPARKVLVIDCSLYGDVTRLILGTSGDLSDGSVEHALIASDKTLEGYNAALSQARASLFAFLRPTPDVRAHVHPVKSTCAEAPKNLFLMTSRAQWFNGPRQLASARAEDDGFRLESDEDVSAVSQALRASLASGDEEWIVLIDTDGGLLHGMTKLALCGADSVVVPTNADTSDVRRLHVMLRYMARLHAEGLTTAKIDLCFFNSLRVKANEPSDKMSELGLAFSVADDIYDEMVKLTRFVEELQADFPHLLPGFEIDGVPSRKSAFFTGIRHGGVTLQRVKDKPYAAQLSEAVQVDFGRLCKRIDQLANSKKLQYD